MSESGAKRGGGAATLNDVAARAGVSPITASRALRGMSIVTAKTREKVLTAAQALDYVPNAAARALASDSSPVVGLIVPSLTNAVFADVIRGIYDAASGGTHQVQIGNSRYSQNVERDLLRVFRNQRPAGMILSGLEQTEESRAILTAMRCPVAQVMDINGPAIDRVIGFDHRAAAEAATRHLFEMGYERPVFIAARLDPRTLKREQGYRDVTGDAARTVRTPSPSSIASGRKLFADALARHPDLDSVLCNNDDLAVGVLFEALARGIACPEDLGICGFNDLDPMEAAHPSLTSVRTPRYLMGRMAYESLFSGESGVSDLGFEVVPRQSTARR